MPFYILMIFWLLRVEKSSKQLPHGKTLIATIGLGFIGYYLSSWLDMQGLNYISAQLERLTLYTYPIMTTVLGWLVLGEKISLRIALVLGLTYSGVMLLYQYEAAIIGDQATIGILLVASAALSFSFYVVFSKKLITRLGSRMFTSIAMLSSTAFVFLHFILEQDVSNLFISYHAWFYGGLLAIFCTLLPSYIVSEAIARIGAAKTSIVGTVGPVFTIMIAVLILNEPFGWTHLGGVLLVLTGVSLLGKQR